MTYPLFALGDVRIVKEIEETGSFRIENAFGDADAPKKYWRTVVFYFIKALFLFALVAVIAGITAFLSVIGFEFDEENLFNADISYMATVVLLGIAFCAIFIILFYLLLAPATYLLQTDDGIGISEVLNKSLSTMKKGKGKLFLISLIHFLIYAALVAIGFGISFLVMEFLMRPLVDACLVALILFLLLVLPKIILSKRIASVSLIKDLVENE